ISSARPRSSCPRASAFPEPGPWELLLQLENLLDQLGRLLRIGADAVLHLAVIGGGDVEAGEPFDGGIEVVEPTPLHPLANPGADAVEGPPLLEDHAAAGLLPRLDDEVLVERTQGPRVDPLRLDPLGGQQLGGAQRHLDHLGPADDGAVAPLALDLAHADG